MRYREFNKTKTHDFDGFMYPIVSMRWILDVEGRFHTFACPVNLKFRYMKNVQRLGAKDWWNFVTKNYLSAEKRMMSWEDIVKKSKEEYAPSVERERLAQEYRSLK